MTQRQTLAAIRALGLSARIRDGEYRITVGLPEARRQLAEVHQHAGNITLPQVREKAEAIAYYTDDRQDALKTAQFMATRLPVAISR